MTDEENLVKTDKSTTTFSKRTSSYSKSSEGVTKVKIVGGLWKLRESLALVRDFILCLLLLVGIVGVWALVIAVSQFSF